MTPYSEKLKDPRWQKVRLEIMSRDNFQCRLCHSRETTLTVHHKRYSKSGNPWDASPLDLVTLCEVCHNRHHGVTKADPDATFAVYNCALVDALLANDSESLTQAIEAMTAFYVKVTDRMNRNIKPLSGRLLEFLVREGGE